MAGWIVSVLIQKTQPKITIFTYRPNQHQSNRFDQPVTYKRSNINLTEDLFLVKYCIIFFIPMFGSNSR